MYYVGKIIQAAGLTIILIEFLRTFPQLMSRSILLIGIVIFTFGWGMNQILVKK